MHSDMSYWIMYVEHVISTVMMHVPAFTCEDRDRGAASPDRRNEVVAPVII